jgi:hypothetical protein
MTATVEFSADARRMLDDADERWVVEARLDGRRLRGRLKRSITQLVSASRQPLSKQEISRSSTGNNVLKAQATRELLMEGAIVHVKARRGGAALIWGPAWSRLRRQQRSRLA